MNRPFDTAPAIRPGTLLGPYEIGAVVGEGGMGVVYRARDTRLKRDVAVKVLPSEYAQDPDRLRRFEREARAAGSLNHPNILTIFDIGTNEGISYVVSELLEGETLRKRLKSSALPVRKAVEYGVQILRGLSAAHEKGIVHRDLKPENLFLTKDGRVKILDFGLAKVDRGAAGGESAPTATKDLTESGVILGTVGYLAPEQVRGQVADARADLFSFGAVLYEMLSGRRAFEGATAADTLSAILKEQPAELAGSIRQIPPALDRILRHCLEKIPGERFQSAEDIAFDLEGLPWGTKGLESTGTPAHRPWLVRGGVILALVAFGTGGLMAGRRLERRPPPAYKQLTFDRGNVVTARFGPDGETVFYGGIWGDRPLELFSTRLDHPDSRPFGLASATPLSISGSGEMMVRLNAPSLLTTMNPEGTLARVHIGGGGARRLMDRVSWADWSPDGSRLAVVRTAGGRDRLEFPPGKLLFETAGFITCPRFSRRGDRIAFIHHPIRNDDRGEIAVVDQAGRFKVLCAGFSSITGLAWAPHGDEIWFSGEKGAPRALGAVSLDGAERVVLRIPALMTLHDVSREGRALITRDQIRVEIGVTSSATHEEEDLSSRDISILADLSEDGSEVLYSEEGQSGGELYTAVLKPLDGSPLVRIGEGNTTALSRDRQFALSILPKSPTELQILPTGTGEPQVVPRGHLEEIWAASFFPDGRHILAQAFEKGSAARCYVGTRNGDWHAVTPPGTEMPFGNRAVAPDGRSFLALGTDRKLARYPAEGGEPQPIRGVEPEEIPAGWGPDGRSLYVYARSAPPLQVYRLDLQTGRRTLWKSVRPRDTSGVLSINGFLMARDGQTYVQCYARGLSDLFLVEGLR